MRYYDTIRDAATRLLDYAAERANGWILGALFIVAVAAFGSVVWWLMSASERTLLLLILVVLISKKG